MLSFNICLTAFDIFSTYCSVNNLIVAILLNQRHARREPTAIKQRTGRTELFLNADLKLRQIPDSGERWVV